MKKIMENLINRLYKDEFYLLFGSNSKIKVDNIIWSTNEKKHIIYLTLYAGDIEKCVESSPDGVQYLISESLKFLGSKCEMIAIVSLNVSPDIETNY